MIGNFDDETNSPHELLLTYRQVSNNCKAFANYLSTNIKLLKIQLFKMTQSRGFHGRLPGPLLETELPLMKNVTKPLAKSILIPLGLITAASAADAETDKNILGSGNTTLIVSNDEMENTSKIVKYLEHSDLLLKGVSETIQNEAKEQKV